VKCKPHVCRPFSRSTVRQIHAILSGALDTAVRWEWIPSNPASVAKRPKQQAPRPHPPTAREAARIVAAAWEEDLQWGLFVWLVLVTGARRGELLALRWSDINSDAGVIEVRRSYTQRRGKGLEKDTKTHQIRRVGLDPDTLELLAEAWEAFGTAMARLGVKADPSAFIFSYQPDHSKPCNPDAINAPV